MTRSQDSERETCVVDLTSPHPYPNIYSQTMCTNTSMAELAEHLQLGAGGYIDHPVVDATGLEGGWNFLLGWTPISMLQSGSQGDGSQQAGQPTDPRGTATVFEALPRALGLKLEKQKQKIPVIVVDHVDEKPIE